jgi:tol-pal system-associated acyl-CoA thioesterase
MEAHCLPVKVYLEDTDALGIVYHSNYLKYMERSRHEMLAGHLGVLNGRRFVVHEMHIKFQRPARLGDQLEVRSTAKQASEYRITFFQEVVLLREDLQLAAAEVQVTCVDSQGTLTEIPEGIGL